MAASPAPAQELPLLIQDYSCANSFEEHVRLIETYLAHLFETEPLLQSFLAASPFSAKSTKSSPSPTAKDLSRVASDTLDSRSAFDGDSDEDADDGTSSLVSLLEETTRSNGNGSRGRGSGGAATSPSRVFSQTMTLYAPSPVPPANAAPADLEVTMAVEVHVRDATHVITQQYCTPLFFLIRKVTASASYRESETNYLLSLLSTAVRQVMRQLKNGAVLRIGSTTASMAALGGAGGANGGILPSCLAADALPSPFFFPDGCAPCFAPAGDSYKQTFVGVAPPLPMKGLLPRPPFPSEMTSAEWNLLHQRSFTTRFLSDAFASPPEQCRTLSDYIDLFQLHVGQHSRIRSDDFEGICVSLWKTYALPIPWKFHPHGPPLQDAAAAAKKSKRTISKSFAGDEPVSLTWDGVLERENNYTQLLSGSHTHPFGTPAPPLKHIAFHFQWNQLQDVEAHEPSGRGSHLDPFQFAPSAIPSSSGATRPSATTTTSTSSTPATLTAAAQAAQRKCCITARVVLRDDDHIDGGVSQRLRAVVEESYLNPLAHHTARSPAAAAPRSAVGGGSARGRKGENGEVEARAQSPDAARTSSTPANEKEQDRSAGEADTAQASGEEAALLQQLTDQIVDWTGASVNVQESLLLRFARPAARDHNDGDDERSDDDEGRVGQTCGGVLAAASRRGGTVVARRLRHLWEEWEAHRQLFPAAAAAPPPAEAGGGGPRATSLEMAERDAAAVAAALAARRGRTSATQAEKERAGQTADKDVRYDYFPDSFFARFAYVCTTQVPHADGVHELWRRCLDRLRALLEAPSSTSADADTQRQSWQRLLDCLALPRADPPVDLSRPLITQKFQLLAFALYSLVHPGDHLYAAMETATSATASSEVEDAPVNGGDDAQTSNAASPPRLIASGEPIIAPAALPTPPTTADVVLQRAMELNTLGAAAVAEASVSWLCSDALYNDMCLFLYVNKAQEGREVRFPDFVHWHSPRDFVQPARDTDAPAATRDDNDYLSDRMKEQTDGGDGSRGSSHVWWALWRRATPRSRETILESLFQPFEQATQVLQWLTALPEATLLLEVSNASVANALHRMLCHRFLLGDAAGRDSATRGLIPASPRLRSLHRYVREKCGTLTKDLEAASAILSSRAAAGPYPNEAPSAMEAMEVEMLRSFLANALHELGEIESCLCTAVAVHYLLGFTTDPEAAATVRALCAPSTATTTTASSLPPSSCGGGSGMQTRTVTVNRSTWVSCFAKQFVRPDSRVVQESMVRLTCMAERPLNTCGCFQQLVAHQDSAHTLRMALALTQEAL